MALKLGVGTSNFWNGKEINNNKAIKEITSLRVEAIEIYFEDSPLSKESLGLLQKFDFVTVHAPVVPYSDNKKTKKLLIKLKTFYDLINAKFIVFHAHNIENFDLLLDYDWNICIENSRKGKNWDFKRLKELFERYPQFGFVLDTCHAGEFSRKEIDLLFDKFKDRIKYIHLSAADEGKSHQGLHTLDEEYLSQFEKIIYFGKPLITELWKPDPETIKKEIEFLKERYK